MSEPAEEIAQFLHDTSANLAPEYGLEEIVWDDLPESRRLLLKAVAEQMLKSLIVGSPVPGGEAGDYYIHRTLENSYRYIRGKMAIGI